MSRKVVLFREDLDHLCPLLVKQRKNPLTISNQRVVYFLLLNCNKKCISLDLCQVFVFCEYVAVFFNCSRVILKPSPAQPSEGNNDDFLISEVNRWNIVGSWFLPENVYSSEDFYFMLEEEIHVVERSDSQDRQCISNCD